MVVVVEIEMCETSEKECVGWMHQWFDSRTHLTGVCSRLLLGFRGGRLSSWLWVGDGCVVGRTHFMLVHCSCECECLGLAAWVGNSKSFVFDPRSLGLVVRWVLLETRCVCVCVCVCVCWLVCFWQALLVGSLLDFLSRLDG